MKQDDTKSLSELDEFALQMDSELDRFIGNPDASRGFVLIKFAADQSVGNYPQAELDRSVVYLEDDGGPYRDRLPRSVHEPIRLKLRPAAKWTDVLSSDLRSEGFLLSGRELSIFERFPLGNAGKYRAEVSGRKERREYTYLFPANHIMHEDIDFTRSEFYISDMLGSPQRLVEVVSAEDFDAKRKQINQGEFEGCKRFSGLRCKSIRLKPDRAPQGCLFGMGTYSSNMYVRRELYEALRDAEVSGLEFKRNNLLFTD